MRARLIAARTQVCIALGLSGFVSGGRYRLPIERRGRKRTAECESQEFACAASAISSRAVIERAVESVPHRDLCHPSFRSLSLAGFHADEAHRGIVLLCMQRDADNAGSDNEPNGIHSPAK
jgi:hypothetical protein